MQSTMTKISTSLAWATLASTNLDRAERFYRDSLGFDVDRSPSTPGILMVKAGQGTGLAIYERPTPPQCDTTIATFQVDDLDASMSDLRAHSVQFIDYDLPYLKTTNGIAVQGNTKSAWFNDPDGNILSLVQM
jgi:catechol 2,3-dioxygenase-like lactoylglutathione lyase family enzyme